MKNGTRVRITKGRMKTEIGTVIGTTTNANWEFLIAVRRDNPKAREPVMWFGSNSLEILKGEFNPANQTYSSKRMRK